MKKQPQVKDFQENEPDDKRITNRHVNEEAMPPPKFGRSQWGGKRLLIDDVKPIKNKFPLPDGHVMGLIVGSAGQGKSYITLSLITQFGSLSQVIILSKIVGNPIYTAIESWCKSENIQYGFASEPNTGAKLIEDFITAKPAGTWCLCIFDDFSEGNSYSRDNKYNKLQIMCYQMLRNFQCHFLTITQSYTGVNTLVRNNMNLLVLFTMRQRRAIDLAGLDYENLTGHSIEEFKSIYKMVLKEKHAYLLVKNDETYIYRPSQGEQLSQIDYDSESDENEESDEN